MIDGELARYLYKVVLWLSDENRIHCINIWSVQFPIAQYDFNELAFTSTEKSGSLSISF